METEGRILDIIARAANIDRVKLVPDATLESLGMASIDLIEVLIVLEEELGIYVTIDGDWSKIDNVGSLVATLAQKIEQSKANKSAK